MALRKKSAKDIANQQIRLRNIAKARGQNDRVAKINEIGERYVGNIADSHQINKMRNEGSSVTNMLNRKFSRRTYMGLNKG